MKNLILAKDQGEVCEYKLINGRIITIDVSDDSKIIIKDNQNNEIGRIELS